MPILDRRVLWEFSQNRIVIYYIPCQGPLEKSEQVYIYLGKDSWKQILGRFLMNKCYSFFQYEVTNVSYFDQLDFVFTDGNLLWDNNETKDWHIVWKEQLNNPFSVVNREATNISRQVVVFWDIENCAVPSSVSGNYVVHKLLRRMKLFGDIISIRVYACMELLKTELKLALQTSGVELIDARRDNWVVQSRCYDHHHPGKDAADKLIISDMWSIAWQNNPKHLCITLISGDRDFAYAFSRLSMLGYCTVLIYPRLASSNLVDSASFAIPWKDDFWAFGDEALQGLLPRHLPHRQRAILHSPISHYSYQSQKSNNAYRDVSFVTQSKDINSQNCDEIALNNSSQ
ncbi:hypothetical protein Gasu_01300 isoform 1 [Galdieria sulphuraria]|uniref:Carbohydrate binding module family 25 domain-containing protein n=1 Tax=Galdieria sulphuraria TaxID=130081 RepID=M2XR94_GALSU|nr:hypothetical protein Gasu_01300 isoform 1 [Galdieria sulphuraria]EME32767.1 hypothetical protein Gasu_01300 isoform 1 [Galdieria sulphuraria]|eukprot:XP_005709287.1 hypothetical protein isoform 1 [Galdieria sulphuraria]